MRLEIATVENGFIVTEAEGQYKAGKTWVFSDSKTLGAFVDGWGFRNKKAAPVDAPPIPAAAQHQPLEESTLKDELFDSGFRKNRKNTDPA